MVCGLPGDSKTFPSFKWIFLRNKQTALTDWHVDLRDFRKINVFFLCLFYLFMTNDKRNSVSLRIESSLQFVWKYSPALCTGLKVVKEVNISNWKSISAVLLHREMNHHTEDRLQCRNSCGLPGRVSLLIWGGQTLRCYIALLCVGIVVKISRSPNKDQILSGQITEL